MDVHLADMIAFRREPKAERRDTCTVWLRAFTEGKPAVYRVIQETRLGPTFSAYLGGDLIDDYLDQPGFGSSAWGSQSGMSLGNRPRTTAPCGG